MADFEIVEETSDFEVVDEPSFEVVPEKNDWAKGVVDSRQKLPVGGGIRPTPPLPAESTLPAGAGIRAQPGARTEAPEGELGFLGKLNKSYQSHRPDWSGITPAFPDTGMGSILGNIAQELFAPASTARDLALGLAHGQTSPKTPREVIETRHPLPEGAGKLSQMERDVEAALLDFATFPAPRMARGRNEFQGPMPTQGPREIQGPPEFIGPSARNLGTPVDLGTLRRPQLPSATPTVTELAQDSQYAPGTPPAGVFSEDMLSAPMRRSPESIAERTGPGRVTPQVEELGFPTTARDRARYNKENTAEFEKPGFLRTAEEKIQDKNPRRPAEEMAPTGPAQGRAFERSRRELAAAEAEREAVKERARAILREQREAMMQEWQGPPAPVAPKKRTEFMESPAQAGFTMDPNGQVIISDGAFPNRASRAVHTALDTLGNTGETGQALKSLYYGMDDYARQGAATNFADWVREIQKVYPVNTKPGVLRDPRREWSVKDYININDKEYEALVDLWYSEGKFTANFDKLDPAAKIRVQSAYPTWRIMTGRASSDPGVQQLTVKNSVTGVETPMGSPSSFIPHQYRNKDVGKYSRTLLDRIYNDYAKGQAIPMTRSEFIETFRKRAQGYTSIPTDDGKGTRWIQKPGVKRFQGVEEARLFDAAAVAKEEGKSVLQVFKEHGLETDIVKLQLRYNLGALHRGQQKLHQQTADKLWANWREEIDHDPDASAWGTTLEDRYKGQSVHEDIDRVNETWLQKVKAVNALTLLTRATVAASNQFFVYGLAKPSWRTLLDRATASIVAPEELARAKSLIPDSGALLANFNQEMNRIDGLIGAWSMAQLRLTGFNYLDRLQRSGAAKLGYFYAKDLGRQLLKDPTSNKIRKQLVEELRLNPDEVLTSMKQTGGLTDEIVKRAMQVYADTSMGTTGVRGKPLYATSPHWAPQLMLNLRGQLVSNTAAAYKMVFHAPDLKTGIDKAARLVVGAALAGTATRAAGDALRGQLGGDLQGSTKDLKKKLGDEAFARLADGIVYGLGTIATDTALSAIAPGDDIAWKFGSAVFGVPLTQIGKVAKTYKEATQDPLRGVLKTIPFPVPLDVVGEEAGIIDPKKKRRR